MSYCLTRSYSSIIRAGRLSKNSECERGPDGVIVNVAQSPESKGTAFLRSSNAAVLNAPEGPLPVRRYNSSRKRFSPSRTMKGSAYRETPQPILGGALGAQDITR